MSALHILKDADVAWETHPPSALQTQSLNTSSISPAAFHSEFANLLHDKRALPSPARAGALKVLLEGKAAAPIPGEGGQSSTPTCKALGAVVLKLPIIKCHLISMQSCSQNPDGNITTNTVLLTLPGVRWGIGCVLMLPKPRVLFQGVPAM